MYAEAEPLYRRALAIREKTFPPGHPSAAATAQNVANLYRDQGRYAEAEPLYRQALAIREKAFGPEQPAVASALNSLANLCCHQGRYAEADSLFQGPWASWRIGLGPEHPEVAVGLNNLALLHLVRQRPAEALPLVERAVSIRADAWLAAGRSLPQLLRSLDGPVGFGKRAGTVDDLHHHTLQLAEEQRASASAASASGLSSSPASPTPSNAWLRGRPSWATRPKPSTPWNAAAPVARGSNATRRREDLFRRAFPRKRPRFCTGASRKPKRTGKPGKTITDPGPASRLFAWRS